MVSGASQGELACPGMCGGKVQALRHYPGTGKGAQPSLSGGRTGKPDSAEQESPCYKRKLLHVLPASGTAGHITMVKNDKDARFINVALTEKGRSLVQGMIEQMGSHSEKDTMSKEDLETILKGLKCLEKYLQS